MKINFQREDLLKSLQLVMGVVERKQTMPILSNILLKTEAQQFSVTGTDTEVELIGLASLQTAATEPNVLTLPGRKLIDICRTLPENASIELFQDKERAILSSGKSRFVLSTLPATDFPNMERTKGHVELTVMQGELRHLLQCSYFAMAQQDVRSFLNGLLLEITSSQLRAVGADGRRLASYAIKISAEIEHRIQVIVPRKGVLELLRLLQATDEPITLSVSSHYLCATTGSYVFTSKLMETRFPDYKRLIQKTGQNSFCLDRDTAKSALQRAAILCNEKIRGIRFQIRKDSLRILANNPEQEAAEEEMSMSYSGVNLDIGFNVNYLLDILNAINPGTVRFTFADANSSVLIEEVDNTCENAFVIMPMHF